MALWRKLGSNVIGWVCLHSNTMGCHVMCVFILTDLVHVSVSWSKALFHLESDNHFRITVVVGDGLGWNPYHHSSCFCFWLAYFEFKILNQLIVGKTSYLHCCNNVIINLNADISNNTHLYYLNNTYSYYQVEVIKIHTNT